MQRSVYPIQKHKKRKRNSLIIWRVKKRKLGASLKLYLSNVNKADLRLSMFPAKYDKKVEE